ncbi:hypothetical protein A3Q34_01095 [Colwellia sp. PAMC 20917]|uniref:hypothetical protein n=1 Tax=Colwellia sp. PAMC 20917 TaxID=1816218 RepID=UPI00087855C0|nr:hypothetical protein [Colwellia sp. PAMC 20917]AOW75598.1 hypothetical protein A3Q34_01095 [Colwellia sp. PAMC 20917]
MKTIPIGKAFSAMLWVLEKEQEALEQASPEEKKPKSKLTIKRSKIKLGDWNFYDLKSPLKPINYSKLVNTLGHDYFEGSLYQGISESINLTNAVDGGMLLTPENGLVCQSKSESLGEGVEAWLSYEVESQISRLAHTDIYPKGESFKPEKITKSALSADEISKEDLELLKYLSSPEASKKLAEMEQLRQANKQQGVIPNIPMTAHDKLLAKCHYKLLDLLQSGTFSAYYYPAIIKFKDELKLKEKPTQLPQVISKAHWQRNLLPHYDYNAIHFGDSHKLYFSRHVVSEYFTGQDEIPPYHQFWLANVQIEAESFEEFIMPLIYRHFTLPKTARLNRSGNKYIINFGEDKNVKVKQSLALHALKVIFLHTNQNLAQPSSIDAVFIRGIISNNKEGEALSRHSNNDLNDESNHLIPETSIPIAKVKGVISQIRKKLMSFWNDDYLSLELTSELEGEIKKLANILSSYSKDDTYKLNIKGLFNYKDDLEREGEDEDEIQYKLKAMLDDVLPYQSVESQVNEVQEDKKEPNALWNTIKAGLEVIKPQCPHLYFHLLGSGTSDKKGCFKGALRMEGTGLIYQPSDRILWDLKER